MIIDQEIVIRVTIAMEIIRVTPIGSDVKVRLEWEFVTTIIIIMVIKFNVIIITKVIAIIIIRLSSSSPLTPVQLNVAPIGCEGQMPAVEIPRGICHHNSRARILLQHGGATYWIILIPIIKILISRPAFPSS